MSDRISKYMLFSCGERRFAVEVTAVDEISELLPEYPLPDSPRFLRGVVAIHGKLAAVLDLSLYLGFGPVRNGQNLLLLKLPETGLAILVSRTERIIFADEIIASEPGISEFEDAILTLDDGRVVLLALNTLVDSLEKALAS
jgi:chemotaxis signal transduction protein